MELVLVRHAQPAWLDGAGAVDDPGLTDLGRVQADRASKVLAEETFDAMYVSPLRRARETADPIAARLGMDPTVETWLAEVGIPPLQGRPMEEVNRFFEASRARDLQSWWDGLPGGESLRHFYERVSSGIEGFLMGGPRLRVHEDSGHRLWKVPEESPRLLLVAHAGTNAVITSHLLGIAAVPWALERFTMGWAGIVRLETRRVANGAVWSLSSFNTRHHLLGLPDPPG
jgi:probable phosphoglycerate mutase